MKHADQVYQVTLFLLNGRQTSWVRLGAFKRLHETVKSQAHLATVVRMPHRLSLVWNKSAPKLEEYLNALERELWRVDTDDHLQEHRSSCAAVRRALSEFMACGMAHKDAVKSRYKGGIRE